MLEKGGWYYGLLSTVAAVALQVAAFLGHSIVPESTWQGILMLFHLMFLFILNEDFFPNPRPAIKVTTGRIRLARVTLWLSTLWTVALGLRVFDYAPNTVDRERALNIALGAGYVLTATMLATGWGLCPHNVLGNTWRKWMYR